MKFQVGLASRELSPAHFDDVLSSIRILLDIVETLRYENDARVMQETAGMGLVFSGDQKSETRDQRAEIKVQTPRQQKSIHVLQQPPEGDDNCS